MGEVSILDVGQGDCLVVLDQHERAAVVLDCPAGKAQIAVAHLLQREVQRLVAVVVTHLHDDHYGGVADFLATIGIVPERFIVSPAVGVARARPAIKSFLQAVRDALPDNLNREIARPGIAPVHFGSVTLDWLPPNDATALDVLGGKDTNAAALASLASLGERRALLCSDVPAERWAELRDADAIPRADALVMPHHGARFGAAQYGLEDLLRDVQPASVVLSVGSRNGYKHPHVATLTQLRSWAVERGGFVLCTQLNDACRVAAAVNGGGPANMGCGGTITFDATATHPTVTRDDFPSWLDDLADPHCRPARPERAPS